MFNVVSRRTLLRGAAGAILPLPRLEASTPKGDEQRPLRFVALFKPNGVHSPYWNIEDGREKEFRLSAGMAPLEKLKSHLLFVDNLGTAGFTSHMASAQRFLSGRFSTSGRGGASLDQLIADKVSPGTRIRSLELTTEGLFAQLPECSYVSYTAQGRPIPRERDPNLLFDRLFRDPLVAPSARRDAVSLLDRVGESTKRLLRTVGKEDQQTLDQYLTVVRQAEVKIENLSRTAASPHDPGQELAGRAATTFNERTDLMIDLIALALWTDSTRCVTYMLGNDNSRLVFDFLGVKQNHHLLSHYSRTSTPADIGNLHKICDWHTEKFARLVTRLKSYTEGPRSLLDDTVVLYGAGMGASDSHTAHRIPTVLAGGTRVLRTGRYVRPAKNTEPTHLHRTLLDFFGAAPPPQHHIAACEPMSGLDGSAYQPYREPAFQSRLEVSGPNVIVQGRLRYDPDRPSEFLIDVTGEQRPVRIAVATKSNRELNFFASTPIRLSGTGERKGGELVLTALKSVVPLEGQTAASGP